ncbi:hypothetical protein ACPB8Q_01850 [Methanocaldococcus indicus]|uniref:hypothetical protein n=1 Tax=Methanocaldococcus indicus TaxID=213231 RepID=UPI003C6CE01B
MLKKLLILICSILLLSGCINNNQNSTQIKTQINIENIDVKDILSMGYYANSLGYVNVKKLSNTPLSQTLVYVLAPVYKLGVKQEDINYVISMKVNNTPILLYSINKEIIITTSQVGKYNGVDIYKSGDVYLSVYDNYLIISTNQKGVELGILSLNNNKIKKEFEDILKYTDKSYDALNTFVNKTLNVTYNNKTYNLKMMCYFEGVNLNNNILYDKLIIAFNNKTAADIAYNITLNQAKNNTKNMNISKIGNVLIITSKSQLK